MTGRYTENADCRGEKAIGLLGVDADPTPDYPLERIMRLGL